MTRLILKLFTRTVHRILTIMGRVWLSLLGIQLGKGLRISCLPKVSLGKKAKIQIGDGVKLNCSLKNPICNNSKVVLAAIGVGAKINVGNNTGISCSVLYAERAIYIGNNVNIGADCAIYDTDFHPLDYLKRRNHIIESIAAKPVEIQDDVWLGAKVTVLKGVKIGRGAIVASGSVVTKDIPELCLAGGIPAKVIRKLPSCSMDID